MSKDEGAQKISGKIGDSLVFRFAKVTRHVSNGTDGIAPSVKGMQASAFRVKPMDTALVYLRVSRHFASSETWKKFGQRAAKAAVEWIASHHIQSTTFGWTLEKAKGAKGDGFEQYFGLARIPKNDLDQLLDVSGHEGIFVSAPRQVMPTCALEWVERLPGETTVAYLERGTRMASLGLALSGGRIAWRKLLGAGEVALRTWQIQDIPASWDHAAVKLLLETNFSELKVLSHRRGKHGEVSFRFRGKACNGNGDRDLVPIIAEFEGANMTLWASLAASKAPQTQKKPVFTRTVPVIDPEPALKLDTEQRLATAQQGVNEEGKLEGDKKRVPQQVRKLPKTLKLEVGKKDGNCMLHALSKGLAFLEIKRSAHPAQLRAELAAHMRKHGEKYKKQWDGLDSRGAPASDFETYVNEVEKDSTFLGELEVAALARILDIRIVVLPEGVDFVPVAFHCQAKRMLVLWYTPKHVDLAVPVEGKTYEDSLWAITAGPITGIRAGGKHACTAKLASSSGASVWTSVSSGRIGKPLYIKEVSKVGSISRKGGSHHVSDKGATSVFTASSHKWESKRSVAFSARPASVWAQQTPFCDERPASVWTSDQQVEGASGGEDAANDLLHVEDRELQGDVGKPPPVKQLAYWGRAGFDPDHPVVQCKFCPFKSSACAQVKRHAALYNHYKTHHGGAIPSGVPFGGRQSSSVQKLDSNCCVHWKCPCCNFGITAEVAMTKHNNTITADKKAHWRAHHSKVTWKAFMKMSHRDRAVKGGVTHRNAETLKRIRADQEAGLADFQLFLRPRANPTKIFKQRGGIRASHGWACQKCGGSFRSPKDALSHTKKGLCCNAKARTKATRRLKTLAALRKQRALKTPKDNSRAREVDVIDQAEVIFNLPFSR